MVKLQNAKCYMKMDLFFFQYLCVFTLALIFHLCVFTLALIFLYFVLQHDVVKPY